MPPIDSQPADELTALRQRLNALEQELRRGQRIRVWCAAGIALTLVLASTQRAWSLACTSGLVCFAGNTPARASEVNDNFTTLATWLSDKVGATRDKNISTTGTLSTGAATLSSATVSGATSLSSLSVSGATTLSSATVSGATTLSGTSSHGGASTFNGATTFNGDATFNGALKVSGHRPSYSVTKTCNGANNATTCTASCKTGDTIKMAFGFHGSAATGSASFDGWKCGSALVWLGGCINKASCDIGAACSSASLYLECW
jgi:hypothetical protein